MPTPVLPLSEAVVAVPPRTVIYDNARTRVCCLQQPGQRAVVLKEPLGARAGLRLQHERRILEKLAGVAGVAERAAGDFPPEVLALIDAGNPLTETLAAGLVPVAEVLRLGAALARILADVHARGIIHRDIHPRNILLDGADLRPCLVDFDLAALVSESRVSFRHHRQIEGTLLYIAPEQTGRMDRMLDHRADLYSLGATLYELATGRPPFDDGDALRLIHDHIAKVPAAPLALNAGLPPLLSTLILRLLEKEPDRRYQSAEGLAHDLERMAQLLAQGQDPAFVLGERDYPLRFAAPSRLIGRGHEIAELDAALGRAVKGTLQCVFISGPAGVGKTALLNALKPAITQRRGWLIEGKCEQFGESHNSGAGRMLLRRLGQLLLAEPADAAARYRERLLAALGDNAGVLAQTPDLAEFLGPVAPPPAVSRAEADPGIKHIFREVLTATASPDRPLIVHFDDLQWAPPALLNSLLAIFTNPPRGVLLVLSARDRIDPRQPLALFMLRLRRLPKPPRFLQLQPLQPLELAELLRDMLRMPAEDAQRLASDLASATAGNPYDTIELVNELREEGYLLPLAQTGSWRWDRAAIQWRGVQGIAEVLARHIDRLPASARELLGVMACLGQDATLGMLAQFTAMSLQAVHEALQPLIEERLLCADDVGMTVTPLADALLSFQHDRVRQAAYDSFTTEERLDHHERIAARLIGDPSQFERAAEHYLLVLDRPRPPQQRLHIAQLLHRAAVQARRSAVPHSAERLSVGGLRLLGDLPRTWEAASRLAFELHVEWHAALCGLLRYDEADAAYRGIEAAAEGPLALIPAGCLQLTALSARGNGRDALALGLTLMRGLGVGVPDSSAAFARAAREGMTSAAARVAALQRHPPQQELCDPSLLALANLTHQLTTIAYSAREIK